MDFFKLSKMRRPSSTPATIDAKLSSSRIMSACKAARQHALAPLDNAEEAPRKRKEAVDVQGNLKKRKVKAKKPAAARKKKRARDAEEEPASPKRAREDPEDWDFDNGVDE